MIGTSWIIFFSYLPARPLSPNRRGILIGLFFLENVQVTTMLFFRAASVIELGCTAFPSNFLPICKKENANDGGHPYMNPINAPEHKQLACWYVAQADENCYSKRSSSNIFEKILLTLLTPGYLGLRKPMGTQVPPPQNPGKLSPRCIMGMISYFKSLELQYSQYIF